MPSYNQTSTIIYDHRRRPYGVQGGLALTQLQIIKPCLYQANLPCYNIQDVLFYIGYRLTKLFLRLWYRSKLLLQTIMQ